MLVIEEHVVLHKLNSAVTLIQRTQEGKIGSTRRELDCWMAFADDSVPRTNWSGNYHYSTNRVLQPASVAETQDAVRSVAEIDAGLLPSPVVAQRFHHLFHTVLSEIGSSLPGALLFLGNSFAVTGTSRSPTPLPPLM